MKLSTILLLVSSMTICANSFSQGAKVSLTVENATITTIFNSIEDQTDYSIFYKVDDMDMDKTYSLSYNNEAVSRVLDAVLKDADMTYEIVDKIIVLKSITLQQIIVSGVVSDVRGEPLIGVNIVEKGTMNGVITGADGAYTITTGPGAVLLVSYVGYILQEIQINSETSINITMQIDNMNLEEVVVVGYGMQKKANLTGSVSSVTAEEIMSRPVTNTTNLLQGKMAGLQITQGTGQPGMERNSIVIRGPGTYGTSNSPLILVDGIVGSMDYLNPDDIESVSVLKDAASAAIYGSRAANGVILVSTKKGQSDKLVVTYNNNFGAHNATSLPELIYNSAETMEMWNEAGRHSGQTVFFTQEEIDAYRNGSDSLPEMYPNFNWIDYMFRTGFAQNHHLGIRGGSGIVTFSTSLSYSSQTGILPGHDHQRYTGNFNVNIDITDKIRLGTNLMVSQRDTREPPFANEQFVLMVFGMQGLQAPYLPDGSGRYAARAYAKLWQNRNPLLVANEWWQKYNRYNLRPQLNLDVDLLDGLTWNTKAALNFDPSYTKMHVYPVNAYYYQPINGVHYYANDQWPNGRGVTQSSSRRELFTLYSTLNYTKTIDDHYFNVLAGYSQEYSYYETLGAYRQKYNIHTLPQIDMGSEEIQSNNGTANEWALQSFFGRVNYIFKDKYLAEANFRYDGTSRIHPDYRWGFFPSFSGAWRISNEDFAKDISWLDNMKLRVSYGQLGNSEIGLYPYQNVLENTNYPIAGKLEQGVYVTRQTDQTITWEKTTVADIGLDYSMNNGMFSFVVDAYRKITSRILSDQEIPASVGLSAPIVNLGSMQNTGIDLELGHRNQAGNFEWEVKGILSAYKNEILSIRATQYEDSDTKIIKKGLPWESYYLYDWIGVFQDTTEINNSPTQPYNPKPGDLKFADLDSSGYIDANDRQVYDGAYPDFSYSLTAFMKWKSFDLNIFIQGVQGRKIYVMNWGVTPFTQAGPPPVKWRDRWTSDTPTNELPALFTADYEPNTALRSTFNLQDASYLRIKSINLGYTLPSSLTNKIRIDKIRVYLAADNLFTFTKYEGLDPERSSSTTYAQYPQVRVLSAGLNLQF